PRCSSAAALVGESGSLAFAIRAGEPTVSPHAGSFVCEDCARVRSPSPPPGRFQRPPSPFGGGIARCAGHEPLTIDEEAHGMNACMHPDQNSEPEQFPFAAPDLAAEVAQWLAHLAAERRMSPKTVEAYGRDVRQFLS